MSFKDRLTQIYHPKTFDDIIGQEHIVEAVKAMIKEGRNTPLMFEGDPGLGKTSLAQVIAREINGDLWEQFFTEKNGSSDNTKEKVRNTILPILRTPVDNIMGKYKYVLFVDESERYTKDSQDLLRPELQETKIQVIFATNYVWKFSEPIRQRFRIFKFLRVETELITNHLQKICQEQGIKYERDALDKISEMANGAPRAAIVSLEEYSAVGPVTLASINTYEPVEELLNDILESVAFQRFNEARDKMFNYIEEQKVPPRRFLKHLQDAAYSNCSGNGGMGLPELLIGTWSAEIADCEKAIVGGGTEGIQLIGMLGRMSQVANRFRT